MLICPPHQHKVGHPTRPIGNSLARSLAIISDSGDEFPDYRYASALAGLSAGVKSVQPDGKVMPGGFASVNAFGDCTLRGLATHLEPLWANGTLDGLDLHTYYDIQVLPKTCYRPQT